MSDPLVKPDKVSVPVVFEVYAILSLSITTVPDAGKDPESSSIILDEPEVKAPSKVDDPAPNAVPPHNPNPKPAVAYSTAGPIE